MTGIEISYVGNNAISGVDPNGVTVGVSDGAQLERVEMLENYLDEPQESSVESQAVTNNSQEVFQEFSQKFIDSMHGLNDRFSNMDKLISRLDVTELSLSDMLKIQIELTRVSTAYNSLSKAAGKSTEGIQTLFRTQM